MSDMKSKIYDVIEVGEVYPVYNRIYCVFMLLCIIISLIPLAFRHMTPALIVLDKVTVTIFIIEYILRLYTADCKYGQGVISYIRYPFSCMAIVDLLSILPSLVMINRAFKTLRLSRALRLTRGLRLLMTLRIVRIGRYSRSASILGKVVRESKESLLLLCGMSVGYIFATALVIFNVEPGTFGSFFEALYWATVSLTTVGYGDLYAITTVGKLVEMVSSFVGIAIVALPAAIITAGLVKVLNEDDQKSDQ